METKETAFKGFKMNGFLMLFINLIVIPGIIAFLGCTLSHLEPDAPLYTACTIGIVLLVLLFLICLPGYQQLEPNQARVMVLFGKYKGTFKETGFFWVNPFMAAKKVSFRARNLDVKPIKVNDKIGNPIMIGLVLVWKLSDSYKAMFEIDSETMANQSSIISTSNGKTNVNVAADKVGSRMKAFENFVKIQSDAALRQVAGQYAYDDNEGATGELTLRSGGREIDEQLVAKLNERLEMAGMEVVEARLNYLAYAPEIAAVMLRRQQASAIISAREKIVEGAVSMVHMALDKLSKEKIVELDEEKKAAMVSNLLVVLCADEAAQPVLNTGTLNH